MHYRWDTDCFRCCGAAAAGTTQQSSRQPAPAAQSIYAVAHRGPFTLVAWLRAAVPGVHRSGPQVRQRGSAAIGQREMCDCERAEEYSGGARNQRASFRFEAKFRTVPATVLRR